MRESMNVFNDRIDKIHIQRDEINEFNKLYQEGKFFPGIKKEEFEKLLSDLDNDRVEYSNDMIIEVIIKNVREHTNDLRLKDILENINIANISNSPIIASAYPKYYDGPVETSLLNELLNANIVRFNNNEKFNEISNIIQMKMIDFNKSKGNDDFTDNYVTCTLEIYEMAIATLIGHEIGHHYFMHTDENIKNNEDNKIKEFKADCYGVDFSIDYLQSAYKNNKSAYRIHQFAGIYIPLIASSCFCDNIFEDGKKHPSIKKRLDNIQIKLGERLDEKEHQKVNKYISKLCEIIKLGENVI